MIRIALVEDDKIIRDSIISLLESSPGYRCVGAYPDAETVLGDLPSKLPDTVHNHIRKIYEKLQVHSRTEAVVKYLNQ